MLNFKRRGVNLFSYLIVCKCCCASRFELSLCLLLALGTETLQLRDAVELDAALKYKMGKYANNSFSIRHICIRTMGHKILLSKVKLYNLSKHILKTLAHMAGDPLTRETLWIPFTVPQLFSAGAYNTHLFNYMRGVAIVQYNSISFGSGIA